MELRDLQHALVGLDEAPGRGQELFSRGGEPHPPGGALKEHNPQLLFQALDALGQGGLGPVEGLRGLQIGLVVHHGQKGPDILGIHGAQPPFPGSIVFLRPF